MNDVSLSPCDLAADARPAARRTAPGFWSRLWHSLNESDREAYLARATDLADLERRQRAWDRPSPEAITLSLAAWR